MEKKLIVFISSPTCPHCDTFTTEIRDNNVKEKWEKEDCKLIILRTTDEIEKEKYMSQLNIRTPNYVPYIHCMTVIETIDTDENNQTMSTLEEHEIPFYEEKKFKYEVVNNGFEIEDKHDVININKTILNKLQSTKKKKVTSLRLNKKYIKYKLKYLSIKD